LAKGNGFGIELTKTGYQSKCTTTTTKATTTPQPPKPLPRNNGAWSLNQNGFVVELTKMGY
jgi:hypothetical protein